jgi:predicted ThiF/HesA family dinucleotide-utilizing enzyme
MALTKETAVDQITVTENGIILVRETTTIKEDGVELSKQYHRTSFTPASDVSAQPENVQAICAAAWTPEVIAAYEAQQSANLLG